MATGHAYFFTFITGKTLASNRHLPAIAHDVTAHRAQPAARWLTSRFWE